MGSLCGHKSPLDAGSARRRRSCLYGSTIGLRDRIGRVFSVAGGELHPDGLHELHVGDATYDDWDVVADYEELETARAFCQALTEQGFEAVMTSDWPLDRYGRGDIALRVPPGRGVEAEAEEMLDSD